MNKYFKILLLLAALSMGAIVFAQEEMMLMASRQQFEKETPSTDTDADAFITAVENHGTLDQTTKDAINDLVVQLKDSLLWSKMHFIYPLVGSNQDMMKYNLKDTTSYNITWLGTGGTFTNSTGFNGSETQYGTINYIPSVDGVYNDTHLSVYAGSDVSRHSQEIAFGSSSNGSNNERFSFELAYSSTSYAFDLYGCCSAPERISGNNGGTAEGFWVASRTANNDFRLFRDNTQIGYNSGVLPSTYLLSSEELAFNSWSDSGFILYGSNIATFDWRFCSVGLGLTPAEATTLYNIVEAFNDALSRGINP